MSVVSISNTYNGHNLFRIGECLASDTSRNKRSSDCVCFVVSKVRSFKIRRMADKKQIHM